MFNSTISWEVVDAVPDFLRREIVLAEEMGVLVTEALWLVLW